MVQKVRKTTLLSPIEVKEDFKRPHQCREKSNLRIRFKENKDSTQNLSID